MSLLENFKVDECRLHGRVAWVLQNLRLDIDIKPPPALLGHPSATYAPYHLAARDVVRWVAEALLKMDDYRELSLGRGYLVVGFHGEKFTRQDFSRLVEKILKDHQIS